MKLKKLALNAIAMEHSEMKQIKAGTDSEARMCESNSRGDGCSGQVMNCIVDGKKGECVFTSETTGVDIGNNTYFTTQCYCHTKS